MLQEETDLNRVIVYPNALPRALDLLQTNQFAMVGLAKLTEAAFGTATIVDGLACTPTATPSLTVNIAPGAIFSQANLEPSAISSLAQDGTLIQKEGILAATTQLVLAPPAGTGLSQAILIQAQYQDTDTGQLLLNFYNAANPKVPLVGPSGNGQKSSTIRAGALVLAPKYGQAVSGTPAWPTADAGYVPLYVVTLTSGQTSILPANIVQHPSAPFLPVKLPAVPSAVQAGQWTYGVDQGASGALVVNLNPAPASLPDGMAIRVRALNAAAGSDTLNVSGLGAVPIMRRGGNATVSGDWAANDILALVRRGSSWQLAGLVPSDFAAAISQASSTAINNSIQQSYTNNVIVGGRVLFSRIAGGSYTWQCPSGVNRVLIKAVGAGGSGGGGNGYAGAGGLGGNYFEGVFDVTPGTTYTIVVGAPGVAGGGGGGGNPGGNGGSTYIQLGSLTPTALGGTGGGSGGNSATNYVGLSGASPGLSNINFPHGGFEVLGYAASNGIYLSNPVLAITGIGGGSYLASSTPIGVANGAFNGSGSGGGGSGGCGSAAGGVGAPGAIFIIG